MVSISSLKKYDFPLLQAPVIDTTQTGPFLNIKQEKIDAFYINTYEGIFAYNICLISISDPASDRSIKPHVIWPVNIERAWHD